MSIITKKIQTLDVKLPTEPGSMGRVFGIFREAKVDVIATWGYEMGPGQGQAHFYVKDLELARKTLEKASMTPTTTDAVWMESDNTVGVYAEALTKLGKAGLNIGATDAFAVGNRFATVIYPATPKDFPKFCKTLDI